MTCKNKIYVSAESLVARRIGGRPLLSDGEKHMSVV